MRNVLAGVLMAAGGAMAADVLVEAEEFAQRGGWVVDQQAASVMGSPYLMAHGLGVTVAEMRPWRRYSSMMEPTSS